MELKEDEIRGYGNNYSDSGLWDKIASVAKKAGQKIIYAVLLLYYVLKSPDVSGKDKSLIIGALGYFILPVDLVPDVIPVVGFTDDLAAILTVLKIVWDNVTPSVRQQAKAKLVSWFGDIDEAEINSVNDVK